MENGYNPRMAGTGGSDLPDLKAEFSRIPHDRGTLGAARSQNPNSAPIRSSSSASRTTISSTGNTQSMAA